MNENTLRSKEPTFLPGQPEELGFYWILFKSGESKGKLTIGEMYLNNTMIIYGVKEIPNFVSCNTPLFGAAKYLSKKEDFKDILYSKIDTTFINEEIKKLNRIWEDEIRETKIKYHEEELRKLKTQE